MLLLGFAVSLEAATPRGSGLPAWLRESRLWQARLWKAWPALLRRARARLVLGAAVIALAAGGLAVNQQIYSAADVDHIPRRDRTWHALAGGIEGFPPLANTWRWALFKELGRHWARIRAAHGVRAHGLLEWAGHEAGEAVRAEPEEWRIQQSLARLYRAAAATDPGYGAKAERYLERARMLAPARAVFPGELEPPAGLTMRRLGDGGLELSWRWSEGAGYHVVAVSRNGGRRHHILHAYDPARTSLVVPAAQAAGIWRYRIKACHYPGACSAPAELPPVTTP